MHTSLEPFHPVIARWFEDKVGIPTPPQVFGWPAIAAGKSALILAPTGSGKTLAAFLAAIDWLVKKLIDAEETGNTLWGVQILYVSPLKALANDVEKNLLQPLKEMADAAAAMKLKSAWPEIQVAVRTGDTPPKDRAAIARRPPHILITTPESLNLMLMSGMRTALAAARYVIVDEVHALAGSKRGVFLSLLLERLEEERRSIHPPSAKGIKIAPGVYIPAEPLSNLIRIGLSATACPEALIAQWLAGYDDQDHPRPIDIIQTGQRKRLDLQVLCPFGSKNSPLEEEPELADPASVAIDRRATPKNDPSKPKGTGHWPEVTSAILQLIRQHKSTLVFGNGRQLVERLAARLHEELAAEEARHEQHPELPIARQPVILPHHGSIAKEVRLQTEQALKNGKLDAVLATSSLELGIDIGSLDLVVQIDSPGNVAAGLQRVGRAGHLEKATAKGRFIVRGLYALSGFAALLPLMLEGRVEETRIPENCLDVLAQQIVAACVALPWKRENLYRIFRRALPYHGLAEKQFDSVVAMLSKRVERITSQGLRPRISFDRVNDELIILPGAAQVVMVNSGVISDTGQFPVYLAGARKGRVELAPDGPSRQAAQSRGVNEKDKAPGIRLGELDEEFVYETKEGDRIILGSQTWRVVRIDADRVLVEHAAPGSSRMPFWRGETAPRSEMLGEAVAQFHGQIERRLSSVAPPLAGTDDDVTIEWLIHDHHFDEQAAENAITFYRRQLSKGALPTDTQIIVEHFIDRTGEPIIAILCPLGRRMNYTLRLALEAQFARRRLPAQLVHNDEGILIRPPGEGGAGALPENPLAWLKASTLEAEIIDLLESTALFGLRFRQNAARALMLPKMMLSQRTPLWQQRLRARHLLALVKKERNFPIIVETYRECLQDALNIPNVANLLDRIEAGEIATRIVRNHELNGGSPMARSLFAQFQQSYLYAWDDPLLPTEIEPTVDQHILDDILHRRDSGASSKSQAAGWTDADEQALRRRILSLDYPARTGEELLEKIEAAGALGVSLGFPEDPRWHEWVVGGEADARAMLLDLSSKRRLLLLDYRRNKKTPPDLRWLATENLSLLLAARPGEAPSLQRYAEENPRRMRPVAYEELPSALLHTTLKSDEAQRLLVEQALKREPVTTEEALLTALPWMPKQARQWMNALLREEIAIPLDGGTKILWSEYADQLRAMALRRQRRAAATADLAALQRHLLQWQRLLPALPLSDAALRSSAAVDGASLPMALIDAVEDMLDLLMGLHFPLEMWEYEILVARVPDFVPAFLDGILRGGHRVWVGSDAGIAFWPRHLLAQRPARPETPVLSKEAKRLEEHLRAYGASFHFDMQLATSLGESDMALALRELALVGLVSSDHLEALRDVLRVAENAARDRLREPSPPHLHATHARHIRYPLRTSRHGWKQGHSATAGSLGGRWFLLPPAASPGDALDLAERAADRTDRFLRRTAFACRELLESSVDGSWKDAYDVLTRMEWAGSVRRGYFVDGIAGSQFALPTTRLDFSPPDEAGGGSITWLSMVDPANIWARASTRWVTDAGLAARVPRVQGSWVALHQGRPILAAVGWGQRLIPLPAPWPDQERALRTLSSLLPRLPRPGHHFLQVRHWDQQDIFGSPAEELLRRQGFSRDTQGLRLYRQYAIAPTAAHEPTRSLS